MFFPAFILNYYFGEHFNVDGVRRPEAFQAVIGGQIVSAVAAERHFSPAKVFCKCSTVEYIVPMLLDTTLPSYPLKK